MSTAGELSRLLQRRRDAILSRFVADVRQGGLAPSETPPSLLVDHVPKLLDEIAAQLAKNESGRADGDTSQVGALARRHSEQRWELGYDLERLVREYGVLRRCVFQTAREEGVALTVDELDVVTERLSVGVAEAATAYVEHRDRQLREQQASLQFLVEAGELLSSSLDYRSTLSRLTALLVPRMADWCAIHLEGVDVDVMPILHVDPAKVDVIRDIYRRFPLPPDSPFGYPALLRSGEPQVVADISPSLFERVAQSPEHLALLRQVASCSWMIVPLRVQGTLFGAITLAYSDSGRHYQASDVALVTELARRAAVAIDNARLYELSQRERSRVEAATRAKDEFVAMISHELRTPLNAILGWLHLLRGDRLNEDKRRHALEVIERNALAQNQLVADLLDISRVISGKIRINPSQVDVANVVDLAVEAVRPAADAKKIDIELDLDRAGSTLRGDGDRLQQVVWNLLSNAVKFTPKGGRVRVALRRVESDMTLTVSDDGEGIDPGFLPHVFEIFRQSDASTSRMHGGLGIGLSIVKHIVELHGGSIEAASAGKGKGSTFTVRLPISPLISPTLGVPRVPATTPEPELAAGPSGLEGLRVLVIDDEPDARELIAYLLESCGVEVRLAASAAEGIGQLATFTPHVVLSDIGMAEEDGYVFVRSLRTHPDEEKRAIPAIALTAFARSEDRTRALLEGFNRHIAKPVEPRTLVQAVAELSSYARR